MGGSWYRDGGTATRLDHWQLAFVVVVRNRELGIDYGGGLRIVSKSGHAEWALERFYHTADAFGSRLWLRRGNGRTGGRRTNGRHDGDSNSEAYF